MRLHLPASHRRRSPTARLATAIGASGALAAICATCDASRALRPPGASAIAFAWAGDSVLVAGSSEPLHVDVTVDGAPYEARLAATSSDTSVLRVAADGASIEGRRLGSATLTVRVRDAALPARAPALVRTIAVVPKLVRVTPGADTLWSLGDTLTLVAEALDVNDAGIADLPVRWSSSDTAIATVSARGTVTARRTGSAEIVAGVASQEARATLRVEQRAARLLLSAATLQMDAVGAETTLVARAVDARGTEVTAGGAASWETSAPTVATITGAGRVSAVGDGTAWLRVRAGTVHDSVRLDVAQRAVRVLVETPGPLVLHAIGETAIARARGYDRRGFELRNKLPAWRAQDQLVAHVEPTTGLVTAISPGRSTLIAEMDGVADSLDVSVENAPVLLEIFPSPATLTSVGDTMPLRSVARNALGAVIPGLSVSWRSTDTATVRVLADGRIVAVATGTARVIATAGTIADSALVTVTNAADRVDIGPATAVLASVGDTLVPAVTITNAHGLPLDRTAASWWSDDAGVARVTAAGIVLATGSGEVTIHAASPAYPDRRDSLLVTVTNAPASVVVNAVSDTLRAVGATRAYGAEVRNARGALLSTPPDWRSSDLAVARVNASGVATAVAPGTARIVASAGAAADTVTLVVQDLAVSLAVSPRNATMGSVGDTLRMGVTARNALGTIVQSPALGWYSTDTTVARVTAGGFAIAAGAGTARVIATSGLLADTAAITVTNAPVVVAIGPDADTLRALGDTLLLPVTIRNARGDTLARTAVTWSTDDPVVARVSALGLVTARDTGRTWIRATGAAGASGAARDSVRIVVTNDAKSVTITLADGGAAAATDTMTAAGQSIAYAAVVRNAAGLPVTGAIVNWSSSAPGVATVSSGGTVTATGVGAALVVARVGGVADTMRVVVARIRRLIVDNAVVAAAHFGTLARPYVTIQEGVNAAMTDDTVLVRPGSGYSEAVTLGRRLTLVGDSSAFVAGGRDPRLLPTLKHDLGAAGIGAATAGASYNIRYLAIQHSVDGEAIAIRNADNVLVEHVHVNPVPGFRTGRGILVESATGSVLVARTRVDSVYGFGVALRDVTSGRVDSVTVHGVGARSGYSGAGIELVGGLGGDVAGAEVLRTAGPQLLLSGTTGASVTGSTFAGEQQLVRLSAVRGATTVRGNAFDLRRQAGDAAPVRGAGAPDPSGLEVTGSAGVLVDGNAFTDVDGRTSLMDAVRLANVRAGATGAAYGALLTGNRFRGGRTVVRSEGASWRLTGTRADSAGIVALLTAADSVTLDGDTLVDARVAAVQSSGSGASVDVADAVVTGAQRALVVAGAARATLRRSAITGGGTAGTPQPSSGAVDLAAGQIEVVGNTIRGVRAWAGLVVRGGAAQVDSNFISRNLVGVRLGDLASLAMVHDAIMDNDTLPVTAMRATHGVMNDGGAATVGASWWGDARGPRAAGKSAWSVGDSVDAGIAYDSLAAPIAAHAGSGAAAELRKLAGDAQSGALGSTLPLPLSVRVVDANGLPLAGKSVLFRVTLGGGDFVGGTRVGGASQRAVTTDASGIAEARFTLDTRRGTTTITTSLTGTGSLTFTEIVP